MDQVAGLSTLAKILIVSTGGYKIRNKAGIHFITFAVVEWVDVFARDMVLYAWCLMTNHLHMIISAEKNDTSEILRDFKKYTSKKIVQAIDNNRQESRRDWMLRIFKEQGEKNSRNTNFQFWRQDNHPIELYSPSFISQRLNYIHNNPVEAGIVEQPEHYLYSSAKDYFYEKKCGLLDIVFI